MRSRWRWIAGGTHDTVRPPPRLIRVLRRLWVGLDAVASCCLNFHIIVNFQLHIIIFVKYSLHRSVIQNFIEIGHRISENELVEHTKHNQARTQAFLVGTKYDLPMFGILVLADAMSDFDEIWYD